LSVRQRLQQAHLSTDALHYVLRPRNATVPIEKGEVIAYVNLPTGGCVVVYGDGEAVVRPSPPADSASGVDGGSSGAPTTGCGR
jgi:hypothetical protein